jgi:Ca2+-binding RTX toxin-like protein
MTGRLLTRRTVPALVAALGLGITGTANATTASVSGTKLTINGTSNTDIAGIYFENPSDLTKIVVSGSAPEEADAPILPIPILAPAGSGCEPIPGNPYDVRCTSADGFKSIDATTFGGGDDYLTPSGPMPVTITANGGAGADYLRGGDLADTISGGDGDDQLFGRAGSDVLTPGAGADDVWGFNGVDGNNATIDDTANGARDRVVLSDATAGLIVSLDDNFNDGQTDQPNTDNIHSDVEDVVGGNFADTIVGSAKDNIFTGNGGDDILTGNGGADTLTGNAGADTLTGNAGDDKLYGLTSLAAANSADGKTTASGGDGVDAILTAAGDDLITAGDGNDAITAGDGANTIDAGAGDDAISGGAGKDIIEAGSGNDGTSAVPVAAGAGDNEVRLGDGTDFVTAGNGKDLVFGGDGDDSIAVSDGDNTVHGDRGNDTITSGTGVDNVTGDAGIDTIKTGAGNDTISGGLEADDMDAGDGDLDTISYVEKTTPVYAKIGGALSGTDCEGTPTPATCEGDKIANAESLIGGSAGDHLIGSDSAVNYLTGNGGNDLLDGMAKDDFLIGGAGDDTLIGGAGGDDIVGNEGTDAVSYRTAGSAVTVTLDNTRNDGEGCPASCENDNLHEDLEDIEGGKFNDSLTGSDGPNHLVGLEGNDTLSGKGGTDNLEGNAGNDELDGATGADAIDGGDGTDTAHYESRTAGVTVTLDGLANDGESGEGDNVSAVTENVLTGTGDDKLTGSDAANLLDAGAGNDVIDGGLGADDLRGGGGNDGVVYSARPSTDSVTVVLDGLPNDGSGSLAEKDNVRTDVENVTTGDTRDFIEMAPGDSNASANTVSTGGGDDRVRTGAGDDTVNSGAGNDYVDGGAGDDTIDGGTGADRIIGGAGANDTADYSSRTSTVTVTRDDGLANDGEANEGDDVDSSTEGVKQPTVVTPPVDTDGDGVTDANDAFPTDASESVDTDHDGIGNNADTDDDNDGVLDADDPAPLDPAVPGSGNTNGGGTTNGGQQPVVASSNGKTSTVNPSSTPKSGSATFASASLVKGSLRRVVIRGKVLVKAPNGLAQSSSACKSGGKVRVTIRKAGKVVGTQLVSLGKTCSFRAPVTLPSGTKGKLKVEVKFLGNGALKASKRTTSLQGNG